ncbi:hypothetical protein [Staphylococcus epidermidis]|uniref:hypothetical protein n=1 Tax=Staphylococcus epidermidis TaxID=1282 RepID=UPI001C3DB5DC|nr:hypothetical protein [Staphylococcus epidermidis]MBV5134053.1 hypothetical protein [Staphylococcus epidermidis]
MGKVKLIICLNILFIIIMAIGVPTWISQHNYYMLITMSIAFIISICSCMGLIIKEKKRRDIDGNN